MVAYSDRRSTRQSAKIGPPFRVAAGSLSDSVALLGRATSPPCATLLAERLPAAITVPQCRSERLYRMNALASGTVTDVTRIAKSAALLPSISPSMR